ncbi:MAG TPA: 50S ribosomal protein L25 [Chloroflexota bacterium]|nr:50S ribosomal protein L25 [Chloroflexota bacterium]
MAALELRAERRAILGKKVRRLRQQGLLPANLYGPGLASVPLQLPLREAEALLRRVTPTTLLALAVDGEGTRQVLVREVQRHPVTDRLLHIDFYAVPVDEPVRTEVPLHFVGEAPAVAELGGTLVHNLEALEIECLPRDLPSRIDVDLSALRTLHDVLHVRDLALPPGVTVLTPGETPVVTVVPPTVEEEAAVEAAPTEPVEPASGGTS